MEQVSSQKTDDLVKKLKFIWDIEKHYWYPLYDCKRSDVIAFNAEYIEDIADKVSEIQNFLLGHNNNQIYEMHEDRTLWIVETNSLDPSYDGRYCERFWFSKDFNWIIYASHECSISFGGKKLISSLKEKWQDWELNLFP
ncbi:hypothetical protein [Metabacillus endolithicus]|uniref:DUF3885 domain-containing protein n=1 Tax=Metabacillus endolithicus TaxID=1535204 RepID=A0ABW5C5H9_9BACI|nr:hypothetical protein [Metabacillus endolithicus]UPG66230.1 hypothetical protein MVE64_26350 [Metabacillus endolithicus]